MWIKIRQKNHKIDFDVVDNFKTMLKMWITGHFDVDSVEKFYKSCGNGNLFVNKIVDYF